MLIILGHLLSLVPSEVQSRELPPLLPLLFEALSSEEDGLVNSALSTVRIVIKYLDFYKLSAKAYNK